MKHFESEVHETYRCDLCEQTFNSQQELLQHQQTNHGQRLENIALIIRRTTFKL